VNVPLVGLLTTLAAGRGFGEQDSLFRSLLRSARAEGCRAYVFTPEGVDWASGTVRGWVADGRRWRRVTRPLPDVVYDRIVNRADARRPTVAETVRRLKEHCGQRYFNPDFLDKWQTHLVLAADPGLSAHLPETRLLTGTEALTDLASRHRLTYLKPRASTQGRGVVRLSRLTSDPWGAYLVTTQRRSLRAPSAAAALRLAGPPPDGLVQQGIEASRFHGRPFDMRALLHRDGGAGWRLTALVARIGRRGGVTSNLHTGGSARSGAAFVAGLYRGRRGRAARTLVALRDLALRVTGPLEAAFGRFGELAVDMVLDGRGNPWLLEVNARPGRRALVLARAWKARRLAGRRIFRYARSLAEVNDPCG